MINRYAGFGLICVAVLIFCFTDMIFSIIRLCRYRKNKDDERYQYAFRSIVQDSCILIGFFCGFGFYHCGSSLGIV